MLNQHVNLPKCRQNTATSIVDLDLVYKRRIAQRSKPLQGVGHAVMGGEAALGAFGALIGLRCPDYFYLGFPSVHPLLISPGALSMFRAGHSSCCLNYVVGLSVSSPGLTSALAHYMAFV